MDTVLSHIVQKMFSRQYEDVATEALEFILSSSESAKNGMMKLLRGLVQDIPDVHFQTQKAEENIRPDMWGSDDTGPRVFIENKFWAGLTENQPGSYLETLKGALQPSILLMIVPKKRELMMWRELSRRLGDERMLTAGEDSPAGIVRSITTKQGPVLALTSWGELLSLLKVEASNDPDATSNLRQLRALCDAADNEAFMPIYANEATNQHIPMLILQLGILIEDSVKKARDEGVLDTTGNRTGMSWDTIGRWAKFSSNQVVRAEAWFGIHFSLWKKHGGTPLWLSFTASSYGRAPEVSRYIKPWAKRNGIITAIHNKNCFAVAVNITVGKERDKVVDDIVDLFKRVAEELSSLEPRTAGTATSSSVDSPVMDEQGESQYGTNSDPLTVLE